MDCTLVSVGPDNVLAAPNPQTCPLMTKAWVLLADYRGSWPLTCHLIAYETLPAFGALEEFLDIYVSEFWGSSVFFPAWCLSYVLCLDALISSTPGPP